MTVQYFDSSAIVKRYVREIGSAWILGLVGPTSSNYSYVASITGVEVVSALARQQRAGSLPPTDAAVAISAFRHDFDNEYRIVEISPLIITAPMALAEKHALRGYDAVQLAAAMEVHTRAAASSTAFMLVTAEMALNAAATAEGLTVDDPNAHP